MRQLDGRIALVTAGESGVGVEIVKALSQAGVSVLFTYHDEDAHSQAMAQLGHAGESQVSSIKAEVSDRHAMKNVARAVEERFGKLHILCNCACITESAPFDAAGLETWRHAIGTNVGGVINALTSFLHLMKSHGEGWHVVNLVSSSAFLPGRVVDSTSQFAVRGLTESLRYSLVSHRVAVSLVCHDPASQHEGTAARVLTALRGNELYAISHALRNHEVAAHCAEILAAFADEKPDARRALLTQRQRDTRRMLEQAFASLP